MAKLNFALLCARSLIDKTTNLLSIIDVVEEISFNAPPEASKDPDAVFSIQSQMDLVVDFSRSKEDVTELAQLRIKVFSPTGDQVGGSEMSLDLQNATRSRGTIKILGLPVRIAGIYSFQVQLLDANKVWSTVAEVAVPVKILTPPGSSDRSTGAAA